jgi:hypothetical protein
MCVLSLQRGVLIFTVLGVDNVMCGVCKVRRHLE